jgi:hypothetical protein
MIAAFALAATLLTAAPADAAKEKAEAEAMGRKVLADYAECVVQAQPSLARKYVLTPVGERMPEDEFRKVMGPRCLGFLRGKLRMRYQQYRAALAERLITVELKGRGPIDPAAKPALIWTEPKAPTRDDETTREGYSMAVAEMYMGKLGECIVRANPGAAQALLATKISDAAELTAFRALSPAIPACVPTGETLKLNRATLREAIAISYYRLAAGATS